MPLAALWPMQVAAVWMFRFFHLEFSMKRIDGGKNTEITGDFFPFALDCILIKKRKKKKKSKHDHRP